MTSSERRRRRLALVLWRVLNPVARALAGVAPWWVVLETRGRRSGKLRRVPLAAGPRDGAVAWLIAVHGAHASFVRNIGADPRVRLKLRGRWLAATARVLPMDEKVVRRFSRYARSGPRALGIEPKLIRVEIGGEGSERSNALGVRGGMPTGATAGNVAGREVG